MKNEFISLIILDILSKGLGRIIFQLIYGGYKNKNHEHVYQCK